MKNKQLELENKKEQQLINQKIPKIISENTDVFFMRSGNCGEKPCKGKYQ